MTMRRMLFTAGGLLLLSASSLAAQEMKVTCKDGTLSKGGQGACSSHGGIATKSTVKSESKAAASAAKADANAMKSAAKTDAKMAKSEAKSAAKEMKADAKSAAKDAKAETKTAAKDMKADAKAEEKDAKGATAQCKDNTYSHAKNRQGMCSGHGGVAKMMGK
jgi:predicted Zn-dependent protease